MVILIEIDIVFINLWSIDEKKKLKRFKNPFNRDIVLKSINVGRQ